MTKLFFDCEMTGLHKDTTLISIGMVSDNNRQFYCEFTDYDQDQMNDWLQENVIDNLLFNNEEPFVKDMGDVFFMKGTKEEVKKELTKWLSKFRKVELWSDCQHYDVVLFMDIFGGAFNAPENVYYIPFDICTVFKLYGIDPDISREAFIDSPIQGKKHNALYDSLVIQACYDKLRRNQSKHPYTL